MSNVILRRGPADENDELVTIELPHGVGIGDEFEHDNTGWVIIGEIAAEDTPLRVRGTGAWLAEPRPQPPIILEREEGDIIAEQLTATEDGVVVEQLRRVERGDN